MAVDEPQPQGPAIRALGSLFKLTQIHLWDDGYGSGVARERSSPREQTKAVVDGENEDESKDSRVISEDEELTLQMNALGLPLSFNTNKEKREMRPKGKTSGTWLKSTSICQDTLNEADESTQVNMVEFDPESRNIEVKAVISTSSDAELSSGSCVTDVAAEFDHSVQCVERESDFFEGSLLDFHERSNGNICEGNRELKIPESATEYSDQISSGGDFGDWMVIWDSYYMRNYFYNVKTQASTWCTPEGMEHLGDTNYDLNEKISDSTDMDTSPAINPLDVSEDKADPFKEYIDHSVLVGPAYEDILEGFGLSLVRNTEDLDVLSETTVDGNVECEFSNNQEYIVSYTCSGNGVEEIQLETQHGHYITKKKKKARRSRNRTKLSNGKEAYKIQELVEFSPVIEKYWWQRYLLFSKYDDGIKMDEEGWFSVTPEPLARHHALRCGSGIVLDSFTGVGGNAIQFAERSEHVIAVDIDPKKIECAHHNAVIYGVHNRIDFIEGDFFLLAPTLKADTVFLSPPWGGPDYTKVETYDIKTMLKPSDGYFLFDTAKKIAPKVVMFLPKNVDLNQLAELSLSSSPPWSLEVEKNFVNGKFKAITAYFTNTETTGNQKHSPLIHEKGWWTFCEY